MLYSAVAIAFIIVVAALFWLAFKWATARGYIGRTGESLLVIGIFSVVFLERLVQTIGNPFPRDTFALIREGGVMVLSLVVVIICSVRLARAR